jgi:hypothetical protein
LVEEAQQNERGLLLAIIRQRPHALDRRFQLLIHLFLQLEGIISDQQMP